jgi:hypothetical protein
MTANVPKALYSLYHMSNIQRIYHTLSAARPKERIDYVLEPLQALIQLACLSVCPIGAKVSINSNLLCVQHPSWTQGFLRAYNHDNKDDLFHLFNVIGRFKSFYAHLRRGDRGDKGKRLYETVQSMAGAGLDKLIQTYSDTDKPSLLQMLHMYKAMLDVHLHDVGQHERAVDVAPRIDLGELAGDQGSHLDGLDTSSHTSDSARSGTELDVPEDRRELDAIFARIVNIYTDNELDIIYNTLVLMQKDTDSHNHYILGLGSILEPTNRKIKKWIIDNIVF